MNRSGVMYLLLSIVFLSVFFIFFVLVDQFSYSDRQEVVGTRVMSLNNFITDLHQDLDRAAYISGFRALIGIEEYLSARGKFFGDESTLSQVFIEAFYNGTLNGTTPDILANSSFSEYLTRVSLQAQKLDISVSVVITNVTLLHSDPWTVLVVFDGLFNISDVRLSAYYLYNKTFITRIPIYSLKDPLYTVNTLGKVPTVVRNYTLGPDGFVDEFNDTSVLRTFAQNSYYVENPDAPSFLQRFTNDLSPSEFGIESIVNLVDLSDQGIVVMSDRSVVDYIYFSSHPDGSLDRCSIQGVIFVPDWFRLDTDHLSLYEVENLSYGVCP